MTGATDVEVGTESYTGAEALVYRLLGAALIVVLVVFAVLALIVEVLYLPLYIGGVAVPVTAVLAAPVNLALVWAAGTVTSRLSVLFLPIGAWLAAFLLAASSGPGGDVPLRSDLATLLLFLCGAVAPLVYMYVLANRPRT